MADVEQIEAALNKVREALYEVFEAGRATGRVEAANELRERIGSVLSIGGEPGQPPVSAPVALPSWLTADIPADKDASPVRAVPGSVKPTILKIVSSHPEGLTTEEVRKLAGSKANTTRGTLWTLATQDRVIERRNGKWFPGRKTNEAADKETSAAPISQPLDPLAADRQAASSEPRREVAHDNIG